MFNSFFSSFQKKRYWGIHKLMRTVSVTAVTLGLSSFMLYPIVSHINKINKNIVHKYEDEIIKMDILKYLDPKNNNL